MLTLSLPGVDLDNVLLVRIEPGISSALHTDCRLAMDDPANVYNVDAYPGVVTALDDLLDDFTAFMTAVGKAVGSDLQITRQEVHDHGAFDRATTALSLVHPQGDKT